MKQDVSEIKQKVLSAIKERRKQMEQNELSAASRDPDEGFSYYKPPDQIGVLSSLEYEIERIFNDAGK